MSIIFMFVSEQQKLASVACVTNLLVFISIYCLVQNKVVYLSITSRQYFKTTEANWLGKVKQVFAISRERLEEY